MDSNQSFLHQVLCFNWTPVDPAEPLLEIAAQVPAQPRQQRLVRSAIAIKACDHKRSELGLACLNVH